MQSGTKEQLGSTIIITDYAIFFKKWRLLQGWIYQRLCCVFREDEEVSYTQSILSDFRYTKRRYDDRKGNTCPNTKGAISLW